jgi:HK97 family phage major capsid protein
METAPKSQAEIRAAYGEGTNNIGGYAVPVDTVHALETALIQYGNVRPYCTVLRTATGQKIDYPNEDDTAQAGELVAENAGVTEAESTMGVLVLSSYKFSSKYVKASIEFLTDNVVNFESWLGTALGVRIARGQANYITTGSGSSQPDGYLTAAHLGATTASSGSFAYADILNLLHSVDPAYRDNPNAVFTMHDSVWQQCQALVDTQTRPLVLPQAQAGIGGDIPKYLCGKKVVINQSMTAWGPTANSKIMTFGDMEKFIIRDVQDVQVFVMQDSQTLLNGQRWFLAFARMDSGLNAASTSYPICYLATHA